jgi:hypothetical protein
VREGIVERAEPGVRVFEVPDLVVGDGWADARNLYYPGGALNGGWVYVKTEHGWHENFRLDSARL